MQAGGRGTTLDVFLSNEKRRKTFQADLADEVFSEMFYALMEDDGISVRKLAKLAGVSPTTVQTLKTAGVQHTTIGTLASVLAPFGVSIAFQKKGKTIVSFAQAIGEKAPARTACPARRRRNSRYALL